MITGRNRKTEEEKQANKEKQKEIIKLRREENRPNVVKKNRIKKWKSRGVICDDFDTIYERYINTTNCDLCYAELVEGLYGRYKKCLDHDHSTGEFRNILCNVCNTRRR